MVDNKDEDQDQTVGPDQAEGSPDIQRRPRHWMSGNKYSSKKNRENPKGKAELESIPIHDQPKLMAQNIVPDARANPVAPPDNVGKKEWRSPKRFTHRAQLVAHLAACGFSQREIARQIALSPDTISRYMRTKRMQIEVEKKRMQLFGADPQKTFMKILPAAIETAKEIMENPQNRPQIRADAAFKFMDRALGKPKQEVEHGGSLIRQLFEKLDQADNHKIIEVKTGQEVVDAVVIAEPSVNPNKSAPTKEEISCPQDIDSWVQEHLGKDR